MLFRLTLATSSQCQHVSLGTPHYFSKSAYDKGENYVTFAQLPLQETNSKRSLGKLFYICVYKISFKVLYILKMCISMIVLFLFKYTFISVPGIFWQRVGKGAYVDVQRAIQKYSSVTRSSMMKCILTREGPFQYQPM